MANARNVDWDPRTEAVLADQDAAYDAMREECPVAYSAFLGWSVFRHADVARVLDDHETFANAASAHRSVPNGLDPPEHAPYRRAIEPFFAPERMQAHAPVCRNVAAALLDSLPAGGVFDCMEAFAVPFALRCQCAFLGWSERLTEPLRAWTRKNNAAVLAGDRDTLATLAREFGALVVAVLAERRTTDAPADVTTELMRTRVNGNLLTTDELTSVLRNWTVGEIGSLAASIGIVTRHLAAIPALQTRLRDARALVPRAIDEILRVRGPLVSNRRVARRDVELGGRTIAAGERVSVMWTSANRDERAFDHATEVRLDRDASASLLYGAGIHVCPGAPLARLELQIATEELLSRFAHIELVSEPSPRRAAFPANGWEVLPVRVS
jgi:cytochrome P450